jgi:replicative DNA helicase
MNQENNIGLSDTAAERAVLAGIFSYGSSAYFDVADILTEKTFTVDSNTVIYKCVRHVLEKDDKSQIDMPTILSAASELSLSDFFDRKDEIKYIDAIGKFPVNLENVRKFAAKIRKLEIARLLDKQLDGAKNKINGLNGDESVNHILGIAEDAIFDFGSLLNHGNENPELLGANVQDYIKFLEENPCNSMGISTGYPVYDQAIGGGLRRGTVNVIGARPKVGKTLLSDNVGMHIASSLGIPVLNLDTEMTAEDHIHRSLAALSEVSINDIETGKFTETADKKERVYQAGQKLQEMPYYHRSIGGVPFEEQLAMIRRWLAREVGLNDDGTAKQCVIIYDYLKLMTSDSISNSLAEFQVLGFMMTGLHNFALRYKVPILSFIQLNRDGINSESTDAASGSDRIIWLCSNFTIFKKKSDEEIAEDGVGNGNRKLVPIVSRHGGGLEDGDYINMHMKGWCAKIEEGKTAFELRQNSVSSESGFIVEDEENGEEEFLF